MIGRTWFFHDHVRRTLAAFEYLWQDFVVVRFGEDGSPVEVVTPSVDMAASDRDLINRGDPDRVSTSDGDGRGVNRGYVDRFPRITYSVDSYTYVADRRRPRNAYMLPPGSEPGHARLTHNPAPYELGISLTFTALRRLDALQFLERVAYFFSPSYTVRVREAATGQTADCTFSLGGVEMDDDYTEVEGDDTVSVVASFTVPVSFYGPNGSSAEGRVLDAVRGGLGKLSRPLSEAEVNRAGESPVIMVTDTEISVTEDGPPASVRRVSVVPDDATSADQYDLEFDDE